MADERKKAEKPDTEALRRREREERDRAAGNPTSAAEHKPDDVVHEEMSAEEKLQERTDDLMRRTP
jgi:hypothetical protein